jgi:phosphatidylglycerol lysyltransferase
MVILLRRLPFTILMETAIVLLAVAGGAVTGELSLASQQRWGCGLHNLWEGRWWTVLTAPFFVRDLRMFLGILLFVLYTIGVCEWVTGTRATLAVYWITNVLGLVLAAVLVVGPLYLVRSPTGLAWAARSDVGPSAGGVGCIGAWVRHLPDCQRRWAFGLILAYLAAKLILLPELFADSAHLMTFPLGFVLAGRDGAIASPTRGPR